MQQGNPEPHKDNPDEQLQEARDRIMAAFEAKRIDMGNANSESANDGTIMQLQEPINAIGRDWKQAREALLGETENETKLLALQNENKERLENAIKLVELYLNDVAAKHGGYLDAAAMAAISSSIYGNADLYTHLLIYGNPKLFKVMQVVMGGTVDGKSHSEEMAKTLPVFAELATFEVSRGDQGAMPCYWVLAGFLTGPERIEFCKLFGKGKTQQETEEFLRYGNARGALSVDEMQTVMRDFTKDKNFTFGDEKALTETWARAHDLQKQIQSLSEGSYGAKNDMGSMFNYKNILITAGQLGAAATIAANGFLGIWKGGALKSPENLLLAATNPVIWIAGASYKGLGMLRGNERVDKALEGMETVANNKREEALHILEAQKKGNPQWHDWESFFATNGQGERSFGGAKAFYSFILDTKSKAKSDELPKGAMTTSNFLAYLKDQSQNQKPGKSDINYKGLLAQFQEISPPSILELSQAFDTLEIGGANAGPLFESTMKQVEQA